MNKEIWNNLKKSFVKNKVNNEINNLNKKISCQFIKTFIKYMKMLDFQNKLR